MPALSASARRLCAPRVSAAQFDQAAADPSARAEASCLAPDSAPEPPAASPRPCPISPPPTPSASAHTWAGGYALTRFGHGFQADTIGGGRGHDPLVRAGRAFDLDHCEQFTVPGGDTGLIVGYCGDPRICGGAFGSCF